MFNSSSYPIHFVKITDVFSVLPAGPGQEQGNGGLSTTSLWWDQHNDSSSASRRLVTWECFQQDQQQSGQRTSLRGREWQCVVPGNTCQVDKLAAPVGEAPSIPNLWGTVSELLLSSQQSRTKSGGEENIRVNCMQWEKMLSYDT